jgi:hypothetical protein
MLKLDRFGLLFWAEILGFAAFRFRDVEAAPRDFFRPR